MEQDKPSNLKQYWWVYSLVFVFMVATFVVALNLPYENKQPVKDYVESPKLSFVSGTEYTYGQAGQVIVEARYSNGSSAIEDNVILVYGNVSETLYDNASVNEVNDNFPYLWDTFFGSTCVWSGSTYICGCTFASCNPDYAYQSGSMKRNLTVSPPTYQILGFTTDFTLTIQGGCSGGNCFEQEAWIWVGDNNESMSKSGSSEGIAIYMPRFQIYRKTGGNMTQIADLADPISCFPVVCYGFSGEISLYIDNGEIVFERDSLELYRAATDYVPNSQTTYGIFGSRGGLGYIHNSGIATVDNIYDIGNGTSVTEAVDCDAFIWYPDKSVYIANQSMTLGPNGNGYIEFPVPNEAGVYEYQAKCNVGADNLVASKSFHVSPPIDTSTAGRIKAVVVK